MEHEVFLIPRIARFVAEWLASRRFAETRAPPPPRSREREGGEGGSQADRASLISRYPHETSAQETNWISLPRHANDRIPFPRLERSRRDASPRTIFRSRRHSSENRITAAVERVPFPRALDANPEGEEAESESEEFEKFRNRGRVALTRSDLRAVNLMTARDKSRRTNGSAARYGDKTRRVNNSPPPPPFIIPLEASSVPVIQGC